VASGRLRALETRLAEFSGRGDQERISTALFDETMHTASVRKTVGGDCLTVVIPHPDTIPRAVIHTAHMTRGRARVHLKQGNHEIDEPVTFTPWIVGGNIAIPPYCHNVSRIIEIGSYALIPKPPPSEPGPIRFVSVPHVRHDSFVPSKGPR
jgi:hypothetical protein